MPYEFNIHEILIAPDIVPRTNHSGVRESISMIDSSPLCLSNRVVIV